jgi:hypothetical protein
MNDDRLSRIFQVFSSVFAEKNESVDYQQKTVFRNGTRQFADYGQLLAIIAALFDLV